MLKSESRYARQLVGDYVGCTIYCFCVGGCALVIRLFAIVHTSPAVFLAIGDK